MIAAAAAESKAAQENPFNQGSAMFIRQISYACLILLLIASSPEARGAQIAFNALRQQNWQPYMFFFPATGDRGDYSIKFLDSTDVTFPTFEALRSSTYRVEYKPSGTTDVSVYQVSLDAPTWSSSALPASYPSSPGQTLQVGTRATITWHVYPGTGSMKVRVIKPTSPFTTLYSKSVDFTLGTFTTDPLPNGSGSLDVDYTLPLSGATTVLQQISGPATDLVAQPGVSFYSWQSSGFTVVPEPGSLSIMGATIALAGLLRRRRRGRRGQARSEKRAARGRTHR